MISSRTANQNVEGVIHQASKGLQMKMFLILVLLASDTATAFVAGPSTVNADENFISIGTQAERGKVEPNENKGSYQDAQIDIYQLNYVRGLDRTLSLSWSSIYFEFGSFTSAKEQVGSTLFYQKDQGSFLTLGFSGNFVHDLDKQFGLYLEISPIRSYNKRKFSNPRLDTFALGLTSAVNLTDSFYQRNLIHFGSGDGTSQNAYLAIDTGLGYKLGRWVG